MFYGNYNNVNKQSANFQDLHFPMAVVQKLYQTNDKSTRLVLPMLVHKHCILTFRQKYLHQVLESDGEDLDKFDALPIHAYLFS